ncbi:hypothetical protein WA158_004501 [Blastocystis sp. Blastoise]
MQSEEKGYINSIDNYQIVNLIGKGTYSKVYKAIDKSTHETVALKEIEFEDIGIPKTSIREIKFFSSIKHPNIAHFRRIIVDAVDPVSGNLSNKFYMVYDFYENDLAGLKRAVNTRLLPKFSIALIQCYFSQVMNVINYLHERKIIHRDIKLNNILITNDNIVKLTDFGLSRVLPTKSHNMSLPVYAVSYRPPEILAKSWSYDVYSDIWACGIVLVEMMTGEVPFHGNTEILLFKDMLRFIPVQSRTGINTFDNNEYNIPYSMSLYTYLYNKAKKWLTGDDDVIHLGIRLCVWMLSFDVTKRPTAKEVLSHEFLTTSFPAGFFTTIDKRKQTTMNSFLDYMVLERLK